MLLMFFICSSTDETIVLFLFKEQFTVLYFLLQTKPLYLYCLRSSLTIFMTRINCLRCIISSNGTLQDISVRTALASSEGSGEQKHYSVLPDRVHLFYIIAVFRFSATEETIILVLLKE